MENTENPWSQTIKDLAENMRDFLLKKDFPSFVSYIYPPILEGVGGEKEMVGLLEKTFQSLDEIGTSIAKIEVGMPGKAIKINDEIQCVVPQTQELKVMAGKMMLKSTLIAISQDNGAHWSFIDTSNKPSESLKTEFPNLSEELEIPDYGFPELIKD